MARCWVLHARRPAACVCAGGAAQDLRLRPSMWGAWTGCKPRTRAAGPRARLPLGSSWACARTSRLRLWCVSASACDRVCRPFLRNGNYTDGIFCARHTPKPYMDGSERSARPEECIPSNAYDISLSVCCCPREWLLGADRDGGEWHTSRHSHSKSSFTPMIGRIHTPLN